MSHRCGKLFLGFLFTFLFFAASAQEVSPYSRFGLGEIQSTDFSAVRSLGGISSGYRNALQINYTNPAAYSQLYLTSMEAGLRYGVRSLKSQDSTYSSGDGFVDYFALAFPIAGRGAVSAGLVPYSQMSYSIDANSSDSILGDFNRRYNGTGRLYKLYTGTGWKLTGSARPDTLKNVLSAGVNFNLMFGKLRYSQLVTFPDTANTFSTRQTTNARMADFVIDLGLQHRMWLNKPYNVMDTANAKVRNLYLTAGAYVNIATNRAASIEQVYDRLVNTTSGLTVLDTLGYSTSGDKKLTIPPKFGIGLGLNKEGRWQIATEVTYTAWSGFTSIINESVVFRNAVRMGVGFEVTPRDTARSFIKRTMYRIGGYYDSGNLTLNGQDIHEYGVSAGFGIPLKRDGFAYGSSSPLLNLGFELGSRGTTAGNLMSERFFRGTVAITFNNKWFVKPQYD